MKLIMRVVAAVAAILTLAAFTGWAQAPLARVGDAQITGGDLTVSPQERKLDQQIYELRVVALQNAIASTLLDQEAERRGTSVGELVQAEVEPRIGMPTNKEVNDFYNARKDNINKPLKEVREQIVRALRQAKANRHLSDFINELRSQTEVEVFMDPPRLPMNLENTRIRGPEDAPVTVVEYSDFQCPFCKKVQPVLAELQEEYGDKVRWAFKDLPLTDVHPEAMRAAQVARCAGEQGKFWEFRAKLFEQELFTDATYTELAKDLKVKPGPLLECADSGKYEEAVNEEAQEARNLGLDGTPAFLVNGILLTGARTIGFYKEAIDRELKQYETASN